MIGDNMKNGFTLIELLAVIVILGIVAVIFVPNTIKLLKGNNLKIYKIKESQILKAAEDYAEYDDNFTAPIDDNAVYITLQNLVNGNYIENVIDTTSGNSCSAFVQVTNNALNGYDYDVCLVCDEYHTDKNYCRGKNQYELTNLVTNGNFEDESNGWVLSTDITITNINDNSVVINNHANQFYAMGMWDNLYINGIANHSYYYSFDSKTDSKGTGYCYGQLYFKHSEEEWKDWIPQTNLNIWERLSNIYDAPNENSFQIGLVLVDYTESDQAQVCYGDNVLLVDLTETFGAGNEPDKDWCDENIKYFDETKTFFLPDIT